MQNINNRKNILNIYTLLYISALIFGCASIKAPTGGPKDTTPPKVLNILPKNETTNFKEKIITLEFDEYFKITNQAKEFSISPELSVEPILKTRQKKLEIKLPDSLEKNTTYTLNFGNAIVDINEGNILKNLTYVFSTGDEIDSLSISGNVKNIQTGKSEKDVVVFIYPLKADTLLGKKKPAVYSITDSSGNYKINNLKANEYKLYAIKQPSAGGDRIYNQNTDELAFHNEIIDLKSNQTDINLNLFKEKIESFRLIDRRINTDGSISLIYNRPLNDPKIEINDPSNLNLDKKINHTKKLDTTKIWLTNLDFDSVKVAIKEKDTLLQEIKLNRGKKDTYNRVLNINDNLNSGKLNPFKQFVLDFNFPIEASDASKIILLEDSVKRTNFQLIKDSTNFLRYSILYPWRQKRTYDIKIQDDAFTAIFDTKNKETLKRFILETEDSYGTLTLKINVPDTTSSYIVELVDEKFNSIRTNVIEKNASIDYKNFSAGKYFLRVVYDENKNGIWDTGNVKNNIQPEKIWISPTEMSLRANWDREEKLEIPPLKN